MGMGQAHRKLFERYVEELERVSVLAEAEYHKRGEDTDGPRARGGWRGPPAAHPRVIAIIREYFFACKRLNEELEATGSDEYVEPLVFVHEMLTGKHQELWDFIAELTFLPFGVDRDEEWV